MKIAREAFAPALVAELQPLFLEHWRELGGYPYPDIPPGFDEPTYAAIDAAGALRVYTLRAESVLVGYAIVFVRTHPHHVTSLQAVEDMLYIAPAFRGMSGPRLIQFVEHALRAEGVQVVLQAVPVTNDWSALLVRMGYQPAEQIYSKRLDGAAESA